MKIAFNIALVILVLLAVSSGVTKIMLMPQDVEFFGAYSFGKPVLIVFGIFQVIGGTSMVVPKLRIYGAIVVAITFIVSLVLLIMAGNYPVAGFTAVAIALLGWVVKSSRST